MSAPLLQLTYISTRHKDMDEREIDLILSRSRANNRRDDITGFLLFNGHRFLQHLEGPADAVIATYARIRQDPRHIALVELGRKDADRRVFASWAMAFERVTSHAPERRRPLAEQVETMLSQADPNVARHFIDYARRGGGYAA
jgi:hypothetical protein